MELPKFDPETKIWKGATVPYPFGEKGVAQVVFENMKANLQHICQVKNLQKYKSCDYCDV